LRVTPNGTTRNIPLVLASTRRAQQIARLDLGKSTPHVAVPFEGF
jgi:hypothetical protein